MTLYTNEGNELVLQVVTGVHAALTEAGHAARAATVIVKAVRLGTAKTTGTTKALAEVTKLVDDQKNDLRRLSSFELADRSAFNWRSPDRIERFKQLAEFVRHTQANEAALRKVMTAVESTGLVSPKHSKDLKEMLKLLDDIEEQMSFLLSFFQVYHKARDAEHIVDYLIRLEKHHKRKPGSIDVEYITKQLEEFKERFKDMEKQSEKLQETLEEIATLETLISSLPDELLELETRIHDWELKLNVLRKLTKEHDELSKKGALAAATHLSVLIDKIKTIELPKLRALNDTLKDIDKLKEPFKKTKELKIFKSTEDKIKKKIDSLKERVRELIKNYRK